MVESKATTGIPSAVASPNLRKEGTHMGQRECAYGVRTRRRMFGESLERCGGWDIENRLLCWHRSRFSTRKAGRKEVQAKGRKHAKQMVVE